VSRGYENMRFNALKINGKIMTFIGPCIVIYFYSKTNKMLQCIKFILFWNDTLHVSEGLFAHHPEFKTVHVATGICQTDTAGRLASRQQYLLDICLFLYVQLWTPDDRRKDRPKHVECHFKIKQIWCFCPSGWFYYRKIMEDSFI